MVAEFIGKKYKLDLSTAVNFEEYMKAVGVSLVTRKLGNSTVGTIELLLAGDVYTFNTTSTFKNFTMSFSLGKEIEYETMDGRKVKATFTVDGNKLIEEQKGAKDSKIIREFSATEVKSTSIVDDITAVRIYKAL